MMELLLFLIDIAIDVDVDVDIVATIFICYQFVGYCIYYISIMNEWMNELRNYLR